MILLLVKWFVFNDCAVFHSSNLLYLILFIESDKLFRTPFTNLLKCNKQGKSMLDLNNFRMKFHFFFVSRGGDSPPPRAPPQSPRPRRFGTLFIPSLLFLFFRNFLFTPLFFHFYMSLNSLAPESAGGADSTLISHI